MLLCEKESKTIQKRQVKLFLMNRCIDIAHMLPISLYQQIRYIDSTIKELKYDFAIDSFVLKGFFATEASFRFIMMTYNILALFKHSLLQSNQRLSTIRAYCFAIGSYITNHSNQKVLKMALAKKRRAWMDSLFEKNKNLSLPIGGFG